jgi:hypothetical protein
VETNQTTSQCQDQRYYTCEFSKPSRTHIRQGQYAYYCYFGVALLTIESVGSKSQLPRTELCQTGDVLAQLSTPYTHYYCVSVRDKNFLSQSRFTGHLIDQLEARKGVFQPVRQPSDEEPLHGHFHRENLIVAFARCLQTPAKGRLLGSTRP